MKSLLPASFGKPRLSGACLGQVPTNQPRALNSPSGPSLTMTRDVRSFAAAACAVEATPQPARDAGASPKSPRSRSTPTRKAEIAKQGPALDQLTQPVSILPGVGAKYKQLMQAHEIKTVSDLMHMHIKTHGKQMELTQRYLKETVGINNSGCLRGITSYLAQKQQELEEEAQKGRGDAVPSWLQPKVTLSVEGNISAGKSTFLKILENKGLFESKLQVVPEPVEKWQNVGVGKDKVNLLMEFYKAPERFAYTFQNFVFLTRMIQERESYTAAAMCRLLERSVFSDKMVFVRSVHAARYMSDTELEIYNSWFDPVLSTLPTLVPNGFIYLRATPETCLKRLKRRGRSEETSVQLDYLADLHSKHEDWLYDGGEAVAAGGPDNQYLWLEPTGQVLKNSRHVPAQSSVGSVLRPGRFSIKRFDRATDGLDPSVYGQQGLDAARLPKVPEALDNAIRFLDTSRGEHMHPILNTVPALVLDCEADVDVERDLDYQTHVADKVSKYCDYVRDYMKARGSAQMLQQHMDLNALGATGSESNGYHLQVNGATLYLDPKMPLMAFGSEQGQRLASAQATSELALPGSLPSAASLAERRTRSSDASHPKGHATLTGGKVLHAAHS